MTDKVLRLNVENGIARIELLAAGRGNPIDGSFCDAFGAAIAELSGAANIRVVAITARGPNFSLGGDIKSFSRHLDDLPRVIRAWTGVIHMAIARLRRLDAPLVCSVQGICAGGMVGIMAAADVIVAAEEACFLAAYSGIGFSCDAGTSLALAERMGAARARRFLLLNQRMSAAEALQTGLVDEVVPAADLLVRTEEVVAGLSCGPTQAHGEIRRLFLSMHPSGIETHLEREARGLSRVSATCDAREGVSAFIERRQPSFTGT